MDFSNIINDWLDHHPPEQKEEEPVDERIERRRAADQRAALRRMRPQAKLDLHGLTVAEALERADRFLEESAERGLRKVLIIHGKGNHSEEGEGVLREAVREHLRLHPLAGETGIPERALGGDGALWVAVRQRSR